jgi:hypothetical protein
VDIKQPIIHDRHLVKSQFETLKRLQLFENKFSMPEDLSIVLCRNEGSLSDRIIPQLAGYEDTSILESNLQYLGIDNYTVLSRKIPEGEGQWIWTNKIKWIYEYIESNECDTEYLMYCDPIDVIFQDSPQIALDIFKEFNCDLLFMSSKSTSGYECMPDIKSWADCQSGRNNRYLNAGVFIGRTEFVKEFLEDSLNYCTDNDCKISTWYDYLASKPDNFPIGASDQDIFRYLEKKYYPRMQVDYENKMAYRS